MHTQPRTREGAVYRVRVRGAAPRKKRSEERSRRQRRKKKKPPAAENAAASPEKSSDRHSIEKAVTSASCGRVVIMPATPGYDGATRHSNNTAELTALLRGIRDEASQTDGAPVQFCVDSTYAIGAALGKWQPRTNNRELVRRVQVAYARLRASRPPGAVSIRHVRGMRARPGTRPSIDSLRMAPPVPSQAVAMTSSFTLAISTSSNSRRT